jgi:hypothetical protein
MLPEKRIEAGLQAKAAFSFFHSPPNQNSVYKGWRQSITK